MTTSADLMRKYADIIREAQEPKPQLDEGVMDMLKPVAQKLGKWLMSKIDPETAKQLKQAYDQAGGDKDKFMAAIGITKDDIAKIAPQPSKKQPSAQQPQINEWLSAGEHPNAPLKVKVLNLLANGIPLSGMLTLLAGGMFSVAIPTAWPAMIWYVVSVAMALGMGNYEFSDAFGDSGKPQTTASKGVTEGARIPLAVGKKAQAMAEKLGDPMADYMETRKIIAAKLGISPRKVWQFCGADDLDDIYRP